MPCRFAENYYMLSIQLTSVEQIHTGTILLKSDGKIGNKYKAECSPGFILLIPFATLTDRFCPFITDWYETSTEDFAQYIQKDNNSFPISIIHEE